jgi:hypothetical protein
VAVVTAVVVGGAVVAVVAGPDVVAVVAGADVDVGPDVDVGTVSAAAGVVVSVVATLARRAVVAVVDTSAAIEAVDVAGVLETEESVRARPNRNAPTATVTTRAAMRSVVTAWSTGLRRRAVLPADRSLTAGVSPVGSSQLAISASYPEDALANRRLSCPGRNHATLAP